jgi:hypothetical protein
MILVSDVTPSWWDRHWLTRKKQPSRGLIARALATVTALGDQLEAMTAGPGGLEVQLVVGEDAAVMQAHAEAIRAVLEDIAEDAPPPNSTVWN